MIKATALKAYLRKNNIRPSSLAKKCQIDEGYLSRLLNGRRSNPRFSVFVRLAAELGLPVAVLQKLLQTSYDSFILENAQEVLSKNASQDQFFNYLQQVLDASDQSDFSMVTNINEVICSEIPDSVSLKSYYLCWYEAFNLTFQNKFETAIPLFLQACKFKPKYQIEKRLKAKILLGLGTAYMARGKYSQSNKVFRQSLLLWDEGFQVARVNMNLGTLYRRLAKYELSVNAYEKAYEFGTSAIKLYALSGLIQLALDKKDYSVARKRVIRGYILAKKIDSPRGKGDLYCNIAEYYFETGKLNHSEAFFRRAILCADSSGSIRTKQWAEVELAILFLGKNLVKEFQGMIQKLESELSGHEDVVLIAKHLNAKGRQHFERHEYLTAIAIIEKAYTLLISLSPPPFTEFKECCMMLYEAYTAIQKPKLAHYYFDEIKRRKLN